MKSSHPDLSARLRTLTAELRSVDLALRAEEAPGSEPLQEFRTALDDLRLTAWTVCEIMNVRSAGRDPEPVQTFLSAERLRRVAGMMKDVADDLEKEHFTWETSGIQPLSDSVNLLNSRLAGLLARHRARMHKVSDKGR